MQSFLFYSRQKVNRKALYPSKFNGNEQGNSILSKKNIYIGYLFKSYTYSIRVSLRALLSSTTTSASDKSDGENGVVVVEVESLELAGSGAVLAMAWNGKDVHEWHKHIAYRVAIYALLNMAIELEVLLSHERHNNPSLVKTICFNTYIPEMHKGPKTLYLQLLGVWQPFHLPRVFFHIRDSTLHAIGWFDFYVAFPSMGNQERKRSKQHAIQAKKEIILSNVFGVCYDVFSGFAYFCHSTQQPLDANLLSFLF
ncbi:hypothetical protein Ddye_000314 [Dipteronia dyeriana]|uniref:Uncharacterized protein n=1 Tax=Dipteronia dyeriana TaxID=168575 RepID=A0AAD9XLP6_9ROSI|nr:hypothetical protein Ddye_000314 [Dipteronia dyeriana]